MCHQPGFIETMTFRNSLQSQILLTGRVSALNELAYLKSIKYPENERAYLPL